MVKQAEHDEAFDERTWIKQLLADQCSCQLCQPTLMMLSLGVVRFIDVVAEVDVHRALPTKSEPIKPDRPVPKIVKARPVAT